MWRRRKARLPLLLSHFHSFCLCLCLHLIDSVSVFWQSAFPSKQRRESDHSYIRADRQRHRHRQTHCFSHSKPNISGKGRRLSAKYEELCRNRRGKTRIRKEEKTRANIGAIQYTHNSFPPLQFFKLFQTSSGWILLHLAPFHMQQCAMSKCRAVSYFVFHLLILLPAFLHPSIYMFSSWIIVAALGLFFASLHSFALSLRK